MKREVRHCQLTSTLRDESRRSGPGTPVGSLIPLPRVGGPHLPRPETTPTVDGSLGPPPRLGLSEEVPALVTLPAEDGPGYLDPLTVRGI